MKSFTDMYKDGVSDIDNKCVDTKAGYKVDAAGCLINNNKVGILNEDDRCTVTAGAPSLKRCPDFDGDSVDDLNDCCRAIKGTIANKDCPQM